MKSLVVTTMLALALTVSPAAAETPANTLVIAKAIDDIVNFDPAEIFEESNTEIAANVYDRLMGYEPGEITKLVPTGAESYEVSADGKTFVFKLRAGLTFQSGKPVTGEDVAFSLQRAVILNLTPAYLLQEVGWSPENVRSLIKPLDDRTVEIKIEAELAPSLVLNLLATTTASIVEKDIVLANEKNGDLGHEWLKTHSAGSGAYSIKSWKPGEIVVLERNDAFRRGKPGMERVIIQHVSEASAQRLLLEKGDVDIARNLRPDQVKAVSGNPDIAVIRVPQLTTLYLAMNQKVEALRNPKVQEAIRLLADYKGMTESFLSGSYKIHQSFWPSGFFASLEETPYALDVEKAKSLLSEAGYASGLDLELDVPNEQPFPDIAQSLQATLGKAGIRVKLIASDTSQTLTRYRARAHQLLLMTWSPDCIDPHFNANSFASNPDNSDKAKAKPLAWRNSWDIPEITKTTAQASREVDAEKRRQIYLDLQGRLQHEGPFVVMFQEMRQISGRKNVQGFFAGPASALVFYDKVTK